MMETVGTVCSVLHEIRNYPTRAARNTKLLQENATLRERLLQKRSTPGTVSLTRHLVPANVIRNTIIGTKNYLTLNRGRQHGIVPGMGVMSDTGVVGKVHAVSKNFSRVVSLLHTAMRVSVKTDSHAIGTVQWAGGEATHARLLYVPKHEKVDQGDNVVTSGYNAIFPEGIRLGEVQHITLKPGSAFYDILLKLSTDFSKLQYVYVIQHDWKPEKDKLEDTTMHFYE